mmetsp:Transcript_4218/g.9753  ORF Transcript_4218/g.9753 Transcript_4218/m.9753 type:complete len:132 (+) Transcript_4218:259-654(+)
MAGGSKVVVVLGLSMGLALAVTILNCAFGKNWWPMMMMLPFVLLLVPLIFTQTYGKLAQQGQEGAKIWYMYGTCLLGACLAGVVAMPIMFLHLEAIDGGQFALWLLATAIAGGGTVYFLAKMDDGDASGGI